jgi:hypothetical protein
MKRGYFMSLPYSAPVAPPQPQLDSYGFHELALFKTYTRESLRQQFGVEAPAFDSTRPIKTWFDSAADVVEDDNVAVYKVVVESEGQTRLRQVVMSAREAATLNLPGSVSYPEYKIAPSKARRGSLPDVWPAMLSLRSEAEALLHELAALGLDVTAEALVDEGLGGALPVHYGDDPRRLWVFPFRGQGYNVGSLLASKYRNGLGAPGRWSIGVGIEWLADSPGPTGEGDTRPPREMPVRDLLPNEKIVRGMMSSLIVRTDREQATEEAAGRFTAADRTILREILDRVRGL